ncbi:unnamed protein product [Victoria cruziana]
MHQPTVQNGNRKFHPRFPSEGAIVRAERASSSLLHRFLNQLQDYNSLWSTCDERDQPAVIQFRCPPIDLIRADSESARIWTEISEMMKRKSWNRMVTEEKSGRTSPVSRFSSAIILLAAPPELHN